MSANVVRTTLVLCLLALALPVATASAKTTTKTVPGEVVFKYGQRPTDPGNCSAIVFVQWADVPGTTYAKALYTFNGKESSSGMLEPPFNDTYEWVATYTVTPGSHWIQIGKGWSDGPVANTCQGTSDKQRTLFGTEASVELTIEIDPKLCKDAQKKLAARKQTVNKLKKQLRNAETQKAKNKLSAKLKKAKTKRGNAQKKVAELC
jgi:hypothetical protein